MDEFGILTQNFGLKPQGKSAPMAASKVNSNLVAPNSGLGNSNFPPNSSRTANGHDGYFPSTGSVKPQKSNDLEDYNDLFGGPIRFSELSDDRGSGSAFDYDSIFGGPSDSGSKSSSLPDYDDGIFGSVPGLKSSASVNDLFVSTASPPKFSQQFDDLLGNFNESGLQSNGANGKSYGEVGKNADGFDDLIPGFGGSNGAKNGSKTSPDAVKSSVLSSIDELEDFAMGKVRRSASERQETGEADAENSANEHTFRVKEKKKREWRRLEKESQTAHEETTAAQENQHVDDNDIEPFFSMDAKPSRTSRPGNTASERETARDEVPAQQVDENDIESFFSMNARASTVPGPRFTAPDIMFDELSKDTGGPAVTQSSSAGMSSNTRKDSPSVNFVDDFSFMFGLGAAVGDFQEIDGEIEERRAARWKRHQETKERMAKAVADMNQRDFQTQQEQEKRHRIAETVNTEIKQWSAGKEGNLRALLSSLQCVLWPECGWQPVPLTDLITSTSVKKVYKKATLCVHPDKVQQKGANTHQKYVSEKVFDILKEAWTKFNSEELR